MIQFVSITMHTRFNTVFRSVAGGGSYAWSRGVTSPIALSTTQLQIKQNFQSSAILSTTQLHLENKKLASLLPWDARNPKPRPLLVFLQATRLIRYLSDPSHPPLYSFDARMDPPDASITFDSALKDLIYVVRPYVQNVAYKRTVLLPQTVLVIQSLLKKHKTRNTHALTMGCNKNVLLVANEEIRIACYKHIHELKTKLPWAKCGMAPSDLLIIQQIGRLIDHFRNKNGQISDFVPSIDQRIERTSEQSAHAATYAYLRMVTYPKYQPPINHLQTIVDALALIDGILATHSFGFTVADYMAEHDPKLKQKRKDQRRTDKLKSMTECGKARNWKAPRQK